LAKKKEVRSSLAPPKNGANILIAF